MQPVWSGCCVATRSKIRKEYILKNALSHPERGDTRQAGKGLAAALRPVPELGASILGLNVKVGQNQCGWLS